LEALGGWPAPLMVIVKQRMRSRASNICLLVYSILFVLSLMLLAVPGDYWPWYLAMSGVSIVPVILGPNRYRIFGGLALIVSAVLVLGDIQSGKAHQAKMQGIRQAHSLTNSPL
jgi:hypothetical protein